MRKHFQKERSTDWIVRAQPIIRLTNGSNVKPDIAVYKNTVVYDVMELKCKFDGVTEGVFDQDFEKLKKLKKASNLRHAYFLLLYAGESKIKLTTYQKEDWMKNYLTLISANVQVNENGRLRPGYFEFRRRWDTYWR